MIITDKFISNLESVLQKDLPGMTAQIKMAHIDRKVITKNYTNYKIPKNAKRAGVLNLLYPHQDEWHIVLMKRTVFDKSKDKHGGQVSFPGGKFEESDIELLNTALRESEEEIGLDTSKINVLGAKTPLYIPVSNFLVFPFVAVARQRPEFVPSPDEVQYLIEVPLSTLLNENNRKTTTLTLPNKMTLNNVPYFDIKGNVVWGATAMMLSEFVEIITMVTEIKKI